MARPIVYGPPLSSYVWSVRLALAEKGVAHDLVDIPFSEIRKDPYRVRHPFAKVPAFEHDGFELYETQAILRYVDERFPGHPLQSPDVHEFSRMNQIIGIIDAYGWAAIAGGVLVNRVLKPRLGLPTDEAAIEAAAPRARLVLSQVARLKGEREFLSGERVSLADLMAAPLFYLFSRVPDGEAPIAEHPGLAAWLRRMAERQSFQVTKPPGV
jgi:glutathione S-transferase